MIGTIRKLASGHRLDYVILVGLCLFAFFLGLGSRSLFSQDVVRYAEMAREMIHFDSWLVPRFNGDVYANKPAPYIWMIAGPSKLIGRVNEWTARLPSALAGLGAVLFTYLLGKRIAGRNAGMYSALSLLACYKFNLFARTSRTDMPFTFFIIAAVYLFYCGLNDSSRRSRCYVLGFVMMSLSVLMKGPAGVVIVLLTVVFYAVLRKEWSQLKSWSLLWGFLAFVGIIVIWLIPTCVVGGPEFTRSFLIVQNFGRFFGEIDHAEPFYYYFYKLPVEIAPLNLLIPLFVAFYLSRRGTKGRDIAYLVVYLVVAFLFFQVSRSRNIRYLLPLYPAIAIFAGIFWDDFITSTGSLTKLTKWIFAVTFGVIVVLSFSVILAISGGFLLYGGGGNILFGIVLAILLVIALTKGLQVWRETRELAAVIIFTAVSVIAYVFLVGQMDRIEGLPDQVVFSRELREAMGEEKQPIHLYKYYRLEHGYSRPAEFFYYGSYTPPIQNRDELEKIRASLADGEVHLLALREVFENELVDGDVLHEGEYMGERVVLVRIGAE